MYEMKPTALKNYARERSSLTSEEIEDILDAGKRWDLSGAFMQGGSAFFPHTYIKESRAQGRTGGRPPKLTENQRQDIADNVLSGRRTGTGMARLYDVSETTVSRIVSHVREASLKD